MAGLFVRIRRQKFTYICYRQLIRHEWIYYGTKNCVIYNSYSLHICINSIFVFVFPGDAPAAITQYAAWMERQLNACQTPRSMYLSIFNSFRVIRCLSQCVIQKSLFLPHFCFPWGRPWGNHAKCCMDGKIIPCLQIVSQHVHIYLQQFPSYSIRDRKCKKIAVFTYRSARTFLFPLGMPLGQSR